MTKINKASGKSAGRPPSAGMSADSIKKKIEHELLKINRNTANNLGKYFSILEDYAMGRAKGCSPTNQISSVKMFIEMAEKYIAESEMEVEVEDLEESAEVDEVKQVSNGEPVMSFKDKKLAWEKKQAEKKGG